MLVRNIFSVISVKEESKYINISRSSVFIKELSDKLNIFLETVTLPKGRERGYRITNCD
jgi:translation initiation factor 2 alpha subunit (eIF-2alpha)